MGTRGSGRYSGIARGTQFVAGQIDARLQAIRPSMPTAVSDLAPGS